VSVDDADVAGKLRVGWDGGGCGCGWDWGGEDMRRAKEGKVCETKGFVSSRRPWS
jgi:hypothetical protein